MRKRKRLEIFIGKGGKPKEAERGECKTNYKQGNEKENRKNRKGEQLVRDQKDPERQRKTMERSGGGGEINAQKKLKLNQEKNPMGNLIAKVFTSPYLNLNKQPGEMDIPGTRGAHKIVR